MDIRKLTEMYAEMIDGHGEYYAVRRRLLEQVVYVYLSLGVKRDSESVSFVTSQMLLDFKCSADIYTETGIERFSIPPHSCFEIKERLVTDSVFRSGKFARAYREKYPEAKVYLLYQDRGMLSEQVEREAKRQRQIELFQIDAFLKSIKITAKINDSIDSFEQDWKSLRTQFIDNARCAYIENHSTFFLGAGVSMDAGGPSWTELLRKILRRFKHIESKKDFNKIYDACGFSPIILGRYASSDDIRMKDISGYLQRYVLYRNVDPENSELINVICEAVIESRENSCIEEKVSVDSIITYNYDDILEMALENKGVSVARIYYKSKNRRNEFPVYHVHGLIPQKERDIVSSIILGEREYHEVYSEAFIWSNVEQLHALDRNSCFFIGLSMTDPNLRRLLDISRAGSDKEICHFAFLKRESLFEPEEIEKNKLHFNTIELQLRDLGVQVIWYENHKEVPEILRKIIAPLH